MSSKIVQCKKLTKTYSNQIALNGIDLELYQNEFLLIHGGSGSGKSTLLSLISGILSATSGSCDVLGQKLHLLSQKEKADYRKNIGIISPIYPLIPTLTAAENVALPLILQGLDLAESKKNSICFLQEVGFEEPDSYPFHLSTENQHWISICRACIHLPKLILYDEPSCILNLATSKKIIKIIRSLNTSLILTAHDLSLSSFVDRTLEIECGKIPPSV